MRKPGWLSSNTWLKRQKQGIREKSYLLRMFSRDLAEIRADLEADRTDVDLQCNHNTRIGLLESLIADSEAPPAPRPMVVDADRPCENT